MQVVIKYLQIYFFIRENYPEFVTIVKDLNKNKKVEQTIKTDLCGGDCCSSYKKMQDKDSKSTYCIFKTDCGDYGFNNTQYFFDKGQLSTIRYFTYNMPEFPKENEDPIWMIEEKIFLFGKDKVVIKERKKKFTDNYTLEDIRFKESTGDKATLIKEKTEEYNQMFDLENNTDE